MRSNDEGMKTIADAVIDGIRSHAEKPRVTRACKIYLAGPIAGSEESEIHGWREEVKARAAEWRKAGSIVNVVFLDPSERRYTGDNSFELVHDDKEDIIAADIVLFNLWKPSIGTAMELMYAHMLNKVCVAVIPDVQLHPWYITHLKPESVFVTLDGALNHIHPWYITHLKPESVFVTLDGALNHIAHTPFFWTGGDPRDEEFAFLDPMTAHDMAASMYALLMQCHYANKQWWKVDDSGLAIPKESRHEVTSLLALTMCEVAEAIEHWRKDNAPDDKLPAYPGMPVELMDAFIRIGDLMGGQGLAKLTSAAFVAKMFYNANRADHKKENREAPGGKKF